MRFIVQSTEEHERDEDNLPLGRPTSCTPAVTKSVVNSIRLGLSYADACLMADITYQSFRNWYRRGYKEHKRLRGGRAKPKEKEAPFLDFFYAIKKAVPQRESKHLKTIYDDANRGNWFAAAWLLQHLHQDKYKIRVANEITGKDGAALPSATPVVIYLPDNGRGDASAPTEAPQSQ